MHPLPRYLPTSPLRTGGGQGMNDINRICRPKETKESVMYKNTDYPARSVRRVTRAPAFSERTSYLWIETSKYRTSTLQPLRAEIEGGPLVISASR